MSRAFSAHNGLWGEIKPRALPGWYERYGNRASETDRGQTARVRCSEEFCLAPNNLEVNVCLETLELSRYGYG